MPTSTEYSLLRAFGMLVVEPGSFHQFVVPASLPGTSYSGDSRGFDAGPLLYFPLRLYDEAPAEGGMVFHEVRSTPSSLLRTDLIMCFANLGNRRAPFSWILRICNVSPIRRLGRTAYTWETLPALHNAIIDGSPGSLIAVNITHTVRYFQSSRDTARRPWKPSSTRTSGAM